MSPKKVATALIVLFSVAPSLPAAALPLPWTTPWVIGQRFSDTAGAGVARSAFGASATQDGDVKDLTADLGVGKASGTAQSRADENSLGDAVVEFGRPFELKGSPGGWRVTLFGTLSGTLTARTSDPDVTASAFIVAIARVLDKQGNTVFEIGDTEWDRAVIRSAINQGRSPQALLLPLEDSMVLLDGVYSVYGKIEATAGVSMSPPGIADASSQFFDSLVVGGSVTAVPQPSALVLHAIGLGAVIATSLDLRRLARRLGRLLRR